MRLSVITLTVFICIMNPASSQKIRGGRFPSASALRAGMEPNENCFIAFSNGDTIRGKKLTILNYTWKDEVKIEVDGKIVFKRPRNIYYSEVRCWQDKSHYVKGEFVRVYQGKTYSLYNRERQMVMTRYKHPYFSICDPDGKHTNITLNILREKVKSKPEVSKVLEAEFADSKFLKRPDDALSEYEKVITVLKAYDGLKE